MAGCIQELRDHRSGIFPEQRRSLLYARAVCGNRVCTARDRCYGVGAYHVCAYCADIVNSNLLADGRYITVEAVKTKVELEMPTLLERIEVKTGIEFEEDIGVNG